MSYSGVVVGVWDSCVGYCGVSGWCLGLLCGLLWCSGLVSGTAVWVTVV